MASHSYASIVEFHEIGTIPVQIDYDPTLYRVKYRLERIPYLTEFGGKLP